MVTTEQIKDLRQSTGMSVMQCKKALESAGGNKEKAIEHLKEQGVKVADKKSDRELKSGIVSAYVHNNDSIGVLLELACETDFVARNEEFKSLAFELAMQVAACDPSEVEVLMSQPYIKEPDKTVSDLIKDSVQKFGERIEISRMTRFEVN